MEKESVLKEAVKDCRDGESKSIIMHSTRVGLSDKQSDDFKNLQLRTIVGPLLSSYAYKEKKMYSGTISLMITSQKKKPRRFLLTSSDIVLSL